MNSGLSIIIVNRNTRQLLNDCLRSIEPVTRKLDVEIIVVDNASDDGSVEMCEESFSDVILIRNSANLGFGQANNQGILASKFDLVLLLNSDTIVLRDSLEEMVEFMHTDTSIGALGCQLVYADGNRPQPSCMNFPNLKIVIVERLLLYKLPLRLPQTVVEPPPNDIPSECDWILGACMLIRKEALDMAGLFDPNIFMYGEEMELCYRIKASGWRILYAPGPKVIHLGAGSWTETAYSPTFYKIGGLLYFFRKHFSISAYLVVLMLSITGSLLRLILWVFLYMCRGNERPSIALEIKSNSKLLFQFLRNPMPFVNKKI